MNNDLFLQGAVARYKGFLHLIKRNREKNIKRFCVPTYDIDLIWHTHQLHPAAYCKDLNEVLGKVLEHDDMDSDRTEGKKLDTGFSGTTKQWEATFRTRYWKAGAMYRGSSPSPLTTTPWLSDTIGKEVDPSNEFQNIIQLPQLKVVEVVYNHLFYAISQMWYSFIFYLLHVIGSLPLSLLEPTMLLYRSVISEAILGP